MIFNSFNFIIIFPWIFLLYYVIPARYLKLRNIFLLVVSYALYIQWRPVYALVLAGVTLVTYFFAILIPRSRHPKSLLTLGVLLALLPLAFFKYFDFVNSSVSQLLNHIGFSFQLMGLNWAVPVGISFFTFQALSYLWDVYYNRQVPERDIVDYSLYVSFFPCILSGPINRASLVIPQLKAVRPYFDDKKAVAGLKLLLWGMFMKVVVADRVALYVDVVFDNYARYSGLSCLLASFFYTIQIYADFAGYSLMALGVGKVLGFEFTENFKRPYFAVSVTDFWHRWHISLSTWLRDYVYIPLGGSRCSKIRNYWNIFVTFFVSGVWHGANWTFIVWGCMHGIAQIVEKMLGLQKKQPGGILRVLMIIITFIVVDFAWIFFRMPTLSDAYAVIWRIFYLSWPINVYSPNGFVFYSMVVAVALLFIKDFTDEFCHGRLLVFENRYRWIRWAGYIATMCYILVAGVFGADQFIYANF